MSNLLRNCFKAGIALSAILFFHLCATAQSVLVTGKVLDTSLQKGVEGVLVSVKNSSKKTLTKADGTFSINADKGAVLVITTLGYDAVEVKVTDNNFLTVQLTAATQQLNDVVVTALGIKKETKRIGYATQEVKGEDLNTARETNVINQLAGKIAGVTVVGSPSGIGGSARVSIRGERSVDLNKNQPLYVIDGVR